MPMKDRLKCYMSLGSLSNQAIKKTLYSASFNLGRRQEFENACSWLHSDEWKSKDWLIWAFISSQEESCGPHNKQSQISGSIRSVICVTKRAWLIYRVVWQITAIRHKISPNDSRWEAINQPNERAQWHKCHYVDSGASFKLLTAGYSYRSAISQMLGGASKYRFRLTSVKGRSWIPCTLLLDRQKETKIRKGC